MGAIPGVVLRTRLQKLVAGRLYIGLAEWALYDETGVDFSLFLISPGKEIRKESVFRMKVIE
jgi:hypothetical protein